MRSEGNRTPLASSTRCEHRFAFRTFHENRQSGGFHCCKPCGNLLDVDLVPTHGGYFILPDRMRCNIAHLEVR